jgi:hypothetical protein
MNPENLQDNIYHILDTFYAQAKTWNGRGRNDKQFIQDRYLAAQALVKLVMESRETEMRQLYQFLQEWTEERLRDNDSHFKDIIISDDWVVGKFLAYVWMRK